NIVPFEKQAKAMPAERFRLLFDFSKPPFLDSENFVSSPKPNNSHLEAEGQTDAWVGSVIEAVQSITSQRRVSRMGLHRGFSYDVGLFLLALPAGIYICYRLAPFLSGVVGKESQLLEAFAYVYVFFATLFAY